MNTTIKKEYLAARARLTAVIANLSEFVDTLPAPDENNNVPSVVDWPLVGSLNRIEELVAEAMKHADSIGATQ